MSQYKRPSAVSHLSNLQPPKTGPLMALMRSDLEEAPVCAAVVSHASILGDNGPLGQVQREPEWSNASITMLNYG